MAKMTILGIVDKVFPVKRQSALFVHRFVRINEQGTTNVFDVQFYGKKLDQIDENGIEEGQKVIVEVFVNGKFWKNEVDGKEGVYLKLNGQTISGFTIGFETPKIAE